MGNNIIQELVHYGLYYTKLGLHEEFYPAAWAYQGIH